MTKCSLQNGLFVRKKPQQMRTIVDAASQGGSAFLKLFYQHFDGDRANLAGLYDPAAALVCVGFFCCCCFAVVLLSLFSIICFILFYFILLLLFPKTPLRVVFIIIFYI
jgi:Flp pilus assembly protein TadB